MNRGTRIAVAIGLVYVTYRIAAVFMDLPSAVVVAVVLGLCTYALIGLAGRPGQATAELAAENERLRAELATRDES